MAVSINWGTKVIYVPRNDLTLIQSSPEIRELDVNWFRLCLKDLEDNEDGIIFPRTHNHNTEVTLSGLNYARIVEIINGYTVEFENAQYTVACTGANHNIADVKVPNQVSLIVNNAAGLITNPAIEYASYNNGVTVDLTSSWSGTLFPIGTLQRPVNNLTDALLIAQYRGFATLYILGDAAIDTSGDFSGMNIIGESTTKSEITVDSGANVFRAEFYSCTLAGDLDGQAYLRDSRISDLNYINGVVERCLLDDGVITLGGSQEAIFLDCWCGSPDAVPVIDMGGSGQSLSMRNYSGDVKIRNKSGPEPISITLLAGQVTLESTVTNGPIYICGNGVVIDNSTGTAEVNTNDLLSPDIISSKIRSELTPELLQVSEIFAIHGLNPAYPLFVGSVERTAGGTYIVQLVETTPAGTTVTRV